MSSSLQGSPIQDARAALGRGRDDDYLVAPASHASELEARAPALAAVLRGSTVETAAREFERLDAEALDDQRRFRRAANVANAAVLLTACFAAALLAVEAMGGDTGYAALALGTAGAVSGAVAAMMQFGIQQGRLLDRWMSARAAAETQRLHYFEAVTQRQPSERFDASHREAITQDRRNAERYGRTRHALVMLGAHLDEVRSAVASGNRKPLEEFVAAVHEQLSVEHRQWLDAADSTSGALARLLASVRSPASDASGHGAS